MLDSDDPATEEFIRNVLRENGQTKNKPGEQNKQPKVQSNYFAEGSQIVDGEGTAAEIEHNEEPVFIKFIDIENDDSEQDIIEKILKSQKPESFYEEQDFLRLEGDDSPWASLLKNSVNITRNLIDPNSQISKFSPDIIKSAPKSVSSRSSATLVSSNPSAMISSTKSEGKVFEQNVKKFKTLDEGPCQMRTPSLQEVESAISTMILSTKEKPKARVVLDIIKAINSKSDENRRRENTAGVNTFLKSSVDTEDEVVSDKIKMINYKSNKQRRRENISGVKTFSKSSADTYKSGDEVVDNNVLSSDKSSIIKGGKIVELKDGFVVADSNGSEQDVKVQVLYLGEPETEAFIQSVLQMDESELRKNTKFTILEDSQDLKKDWQIEIIDNERLKKLIKYEQPIESSDGARDWFNFENITKTTVQILKPLNGKQIKQHGTQPSENDSKITLLQGEKLQKGRSNSFVSPSINQDSENLKKSSNEKLQETKLVNSGSVSKVNQKENFKTTIIGVKKIGMIETASSNNRETQINSNAIKMNAKPLEEIDYSESVPQLPKNVTNEADESAYEMDQWLENTSQYGTELFSVEDFTTPQYQEGETFVPTEPQENQSDVNGINFDSVHKALFFNTKYSTKPNFEGADEPEIAEENQDMFTAESSGFPATFILQPPKIKKDAGKTEQDEEDAEKAKDENDIEDTVTTQQDKDVVAKYQKYGQTAAKAQKIKEDSVESQTFRNDALRAKTVKDPKDQKSYDNGVTVTDQEAEDEEKMIEAAMNFEQKHLVARSWDKKDKLKGIDQVVRTKTQVSFHLIQIV